MGSCRSKEERTRQDGIAGCARGELSWAAGKARLGARIVEIRSVDNAAALRPRFVELSPFAHPSIDSPPPCSVASLKGILSLAGASKRPSE